MKHEFKGTLSPWNYKPPTDKFDAFTFSNNGKIIGYCAKNSKKDRYNELLRSTAPEMFEMLKRLLDALDEVELSGETQEIIVPIMAEADKLLTKATQLP